MLNNQRKKFRLFLAANLAKLAYFLAPKGKWQKRSLSIYLNKHYERKKRAPYDSCNLQEKVANITAGNRHINRNKYKNGTPRIVK